MNNSELIKDVRENIKSMEAAISSSYALLRKLGATTNDLRLVCKPALSWERMHSESCYKSRASSRVYYMIRNGVLGPMSLWRVIDARETQIACHLVGEYSCLRRAAQEDWNAFDELTLPALPEKGEF